MIATPLDQIVYYGRRSTHVLKVVFKQLDVSQVSVYSIRVSLRSVNSNGLYWIIPFRTISAKFTGKTLTVVRTLMLPRSL